MFNVKFYVCALVGVLIKWLYEMHGATMQFVMSVRPSVRTEELGSHWTDFHEIWFLSIVRKTTMKIQISIKCNKNNGSLHEDQYTLLIYFAQFFFEWDMFQIKII